VLVGSGTDPSNVASLLSTARGAIVGTSLLRDGRADPARVRALVEARG
jgi:predicted TIM-barrel enzyme